MKNKFKYKILGCILAIAVIFNSPAGLVYAWEQDAHELINQNAIRVFNESYAKSSKYERAYVNFDRFVTAPAVTVSGKFSQTYYQHWFLRRASEHIVHGGFSADEPHVYVSVKHFYDPLALSGVHELTDQYYLHGWHIYEAVPATDWALYRVDNPYCLKMAMLNYQHSLQIPWDAPVRNIPALGDFRDLEGNPEDLDEMRSMYAGKAMRGLGEVLHMVGDMTQPAHVRNDAHPRYEITEQAITGNVASVLVRHPRLDGLNLSSFGDRTLDLMDGIARWTNANFYSEDTIADAQMNITPRNRQIPYSSPQLSNMDRRIHDRHITWFQNFGGRDIPMVRMLMGVFYDSYQITEEFAIEQGRVLIPLAVAACAKTIDNFFPTLKVTQTITEQPPDKEILEDAEDQGAEELRQFSFNSVVTHETANDPEWRHMGITIRYSGPGEIWRTRNYRPEKIADVDFKNGNIVRYQDPATGEMVNGTPVFWMPIGSERKVKLGGEAVDYVIEMDDSLYTVIHGGVQILSSEEYIFERTPPKISLEADRTVIMPGEKVEFTAEIENPPERYRLEWTFGDEEDDEENIRPPTVNRNTEMTHTYNREKEYTATVKIIDTKRNVVRAQDSVHISSYMGEMAGPWDIVMEITEESSFFRGIIVAIMKFFVNVFIVPLLNALGEDPGDIASEIDSFTFVGTTLTYTLDLRRIDESEIEYEGPFTFIESNTGFIEGAEDVYALRMEIRDGYIVMIALAYDDYGNQVEFEYLENGKLVSPGVIEGQFSLPGFMSGTWTATKR